MKMNIPVRFKNVWFWVGVGGVLLTALGIEPQMLTSWEALKQAVMDVLGNPFLLGSAAIALLGQFVDPTTAGIGDSAQAMTYKEPKKDE
jgi:phi LC3 family holin